MLYNFNNTIVSALNFNILKTNLSKIASKEVKIYVLENYFLKMGVVQQLQCCAMFFIVIRFYRIPLTTF